MVLVSSGLPGFTGQGDITRLQSMGCLSTDQVNILFGSLGEQWKSKYILFNRFVSIFHLVTMPNSNSLANSYDLLEKVLDDPNPDHIWPWISENESPPNQIKSAILARDISTLTDKFMQYPSFVWSFLDSSNYYNILHHCVLSNYLSGTILLMKNFSRCSQLNQVTAAGDTALHIASRNFKLFHIEQLVQAPGVDTSVVNRDGRNWIHLLLLACSRRKGGSEKKGFKGKIDLDLHGKVTNTDPLLDISSVMTEDDGISSKIDSIFLIGLLAWRDTHYSKYATDKEFQQRSRRARVSSVTDRNMSAATEGSDVAETDPNSKTLIDFNHNDSLISLVLQQDNFGFNCMDYALDTDNVSVIQHLLGALVQYYFHTCKQEDSGLLLRGDGVSSVGEGSGGMVGSLSALSVLSKYILHVVRKNALTNPTLQVFHSPLHTYTLSEEHSSDIPVVRPVNFLLYAVQMGFENSLMSLLNLSFFRNAVNDVGIAWTCSELSSGKSNDSENAPRVLMSPLLCALWHSSSINIIRLLIVKGAKVHNSLLESGYRAALSVTASQDNWNSNYLETRVHQQCHLSYISDTLVRRLDNIFAVCSYLGNVEAMRLLCLGLDRSPVRILLREDQIDAHRSLLPVNASMPLSSYARGFVFAGHEYQSNPLVSAILRSAYWTAPVPTSGALSPRGSLSGGVIDYLLSQTTFQDLFDTPDGSLWNFTPFAAACANLDLEAVKSLLAYCERDVIKFHKHKIDSCIWRKMAYDRVNADDSHTPIVNLVKVMSMTKVQLNDQLHKVDGFVNATGSKKTQSPTENFARMLLFGKKFAGSVSLCFFTVRTLVEDYNASVGLIQTEEFNEFADDLVTKTRQIDPVLFRFLELIMESTKAAGGIASLGSQLSRALRSPRLLTNKISNVLKILCSLFAGLPSQWEGRIESIDGFGAIVDPMDYLNMVLFQPNVGFVDLFGQLGVPSSDSCSVSGFVDYIKEGSFRQYVNSYCSDKSDMGSGHIVLDRLIRGAKCVLEVYDLIFRQLFTSGPCEEVPSNVDIEPCSALTMSPAAFRSSCTESVVGLLHLSYEYYVIKLQKELTKYLDKPVHYYPCNLLVGESVANGLEKAYMTFDRSLCGGTTGVGLHSLSSYGHNPGGLTMNSKEYHQKLYLNRSLRQAQSSLIWNEISSSSEFYKKTSAKAIHCSAVWLPCSRESITKGWWWDVVKEKNWSLCEQLLSVVCEYERDFESFFLYCMENECSHSFARKLLRLRRRDLGTSSKLLTISVAKRYPGVLLGLLLGGCFDTHLDLASLILNIPSITHRSQFSYISARPRNNINLDGDMHSAGMCVSNKTLENGMMTNGEIEGSMVSGTVSNSWESDYTLDERVGLIREIIELYESGAKLSCSGVDDLFPKWKQELKGNNCGKSVLFLSFSMPVLDSNPNRPCCDDNLNTTYYCCCDRFHALFGLTITTRPLDDNAIIRVMKAPSGYVIRNTNPLLVLEIINVSGDPLAPGLNGRNWPSSIFTALCDCFGDIVLSNPTGDDTPVDASASKWSNKLFKWTISFKTACCTNPVGDFFGIKNAPLLRMAVTRGSTPLLEHLHANMEDLGYPSIGFSNIALDESPLLLAAKSGNLEALRCILESPGTLNDTSEYLRLDQCCYPYLKICGFEVNLEKWQDDVIVYHQRSRSDAENKLDSLCGMHGINGDIINGMLSIIRASMALDMKMDTTVSDFMSQMSFAMKLQRLNGKEISLSHFIGRLSRVFMVCGITDDASLQREVTALVLHPMDSCYVIARCLEGDADMFVEPYSLSANVEKLPAVKLWKQWLDSIHHTLIGPAGIAFCHTYHALVQRGLHIPRKKFSFDYVESAFSKAPMCALEPFTDLPIYNEKSSALFSSMDSTAETSLPATVTWIGKAESVISEFALSEMDSVDLDSLLETTHFNTSIYAMVCADMISMLSCSDSLPTARQPASNWIHVSVFPLLTIRRDQFHSLLFSRGLATVGGVSKSGSGSSTSSSFGDTDSDSGVSVSSEPLTNAHRNAGVHGELYILSGMMRKVISMIISLCSSMYPKEIALFQITFEDFMELELEAPSLANVNGSYSAHSVLGFLAKLSLIFHMENSQPIGNEVTSLMLSLLSESVAMVDQFITENLTFDGSLLPTPSFLAGCSAKDQYETIETVRASEQLLIFFKQFSTASAERSIRPGISTIFSPFYKKLNETKLKKNSFHVDNPGIYKGYVHLTPNPGRILIAAIESTNYVVVRYVLECCDAIFGSCEIPNICRMVVGETNALLKAATVGSSDILRLLIRCSVSGKTSMCCVSDQEFVDGLVDADANPLGMPAALKGQFTIDMWQLMYVTLLEVNRVCVGRDIDPGNRVFHQKHFEKMKVRKSHESILKLLLSYINCKVPVLTTKGSQFDWDTAIRILDLSAMGELWDVCFSLFKVLFPVSGRSIIDELCGTIYSADGQRNESNSLQMCFPFLHTAARCKRIELFVYIHDMLEYSFWTTRNKSELQYLQDTALIVRFVVSTSQSDVVASGLVNKDAEELKVADTQSFPNVDGINSSPLKKFQMLQYVGVTRLTKPSHSLLHDCILSGDSRIAELVLKLTIRVIVDIRGPTQAHNGVLYGYQDLGLLHYCCYFGMSDVLDSLLKPPFQLQYNDSRVSTFPHPLLRGYLCTPMEVSIIMGHSACVELLLQQSFSSTCADILMRFALQRGSVEAQLSTNSSNTFSSGVEMVSSLVNLFHLAVSQRRDDICVLLFTFIKQWYLPLTESEHPYGPTDVCTDEGASSRQPVQAEKPSTVEEKVNQSSQGALDKLYQVIWNRNWALFSEQLLLCCSNQLGKLFSLLVSNLSMEWLGEHCNTVDNGAAAAGQFLRQLFDLAVAHGKVDVASSLLDAFYKNPVILGPPPAIRSSVMPFNCFCALLEYCISHHHNIGVIPLQKTMTTSAEFRGQFTGSYRSKIFLLGAGANKKKSEEKQLSTLDQLIMNGNKLKQKNNFFAVKDGKKPELSALKNKYSISDGQGVLLEKKQQRRNEAKEFVITDANGKSITFHRK